MLILSIDSSSQAATAALVRDGELLCEYTQNQLKTHSIKMLPMVEQMLSDVGVLLSDVDVFACGVGPGSFTGLRIGVATVRGFSKTLAKDAVAVHSLEVLANNVKSTDRKVVSLLFAREQECYTAVFEDGEEVVPPCVMTLAEIVDYVKDTPCLFVGDGAVKNREHLLSGCANARIAEGRDHVISAASLGEVAYRKVLAGNLSGCEGLIPLYLRKSQAEREYDEKHKNQ